MRVEIYRVTSDNKQTLGTLEVKDDYGNVVFNCLTLELPYNHNVKFISRIPQGEYEVEKRISDRLNEHFHVLDVDNRTFIMIHAGNYYTDIRGCILVGKTLKDINSDGEKDVTESRKTLDILLNLLPDYFELQIFDESED